MQETTVRYGPFVLPPAGQGGDMDHANVVLPNVPKPCEDCFIVRAEPDLVYDDGTPANLDTGLMLHHAVLFNTRPGRHDLWDGHVLRPARGAVPGLGQRAHRQAAARPATATTSAGSR